MKLSNIIVGVFCLFCPKHTPIAQGTKDSIEMAKAELKADSVAIKVDSLVNANDSLSTVMRSVVSNLENAANELPEKVRRLQNDVAKLASRKPDTIAVIKTKYVAVPSKEDYWAKQRAYSDSLAQFKKDSIKQSWKDRSFFRKVLGIHPRKTKKK